jgi:CSLREA domain-containing protein
MRVVSLVAVIAGLLSIALLSPTPPAAGGSTIVVETTADEVQVDGLCSLRQAVTSANLNVAFDCVAGTGPNDVIMIPNGTYVIDSVELAITETVTIRGGSSAENVIIDGNDATRIFSVTGVTPSLTLEDLTLRRGNAVGAVNSGLGGAVYAAGADLTLTGMIIEDNTAADGGGGVQFDGTSDTDEATITDSTIRNNRVTSNTGSAGGGIFSSGHLTIEGSLIENNGMGDAPRFGGGVHVGSGLGPRQLIIRDTVITGNQAFFVAGLDTAFDTTVERTQITNNHAVNSGGGAGFFNETMTLDDSTISGNTAEGTGGGSGITNAANLTITNSTISDNGSPTAGNGGGITNQSNFIVATLTVENSTITGNQTAPDHGGGGIHNREDETVTVIDTTIADNTAGHGGGVWSQGQIALNETAVYENEAADGRGGGLDLEAPASLTNVTISDNIGSALAAADGAALTLQNVTLAAGQGLAPTSANGSTGIENEGNITARNTIIAGGVPNCTGGPLNSFGGNVEDADACGLDADSDQVATDPLLGPLADNGGPTLTRALLEDSPAIDTGVAGNCPPTDQRGQPRPQGVACDVGAYESAFAVDTPTPSPSPGGATPTASPAPAQEVIWGDNNCSGSADPVDSLLTLRFDAGLSANTGDCPPLGASVDVISASAHLWGDIDCSAQLPDPVDSLKLLRFDAGLSVSQGPGCPAMGAEVTIVEA